MVSKRVLAALFFSLLIATAALAQSVIPAEPTDVSMTSSAEYGHASGGELSLITKRPDRLSGSFSIGMSSSSLFGSGRNLGATVGGTVVPDKVWFFASAQQGSSITSRFANALPQGANTNVQTRAIDTNFFAQLGDRQTLSATVANNRDAGLTTAGTIAPFTSQFLSLHYTGVISANSFFTANVSRSVVK